MSLGAPIAAIGMIGSHRNNKKLNRLLKNAPKYKIQKEAYENQALAKSQAFGRDRTIQMQQEQVDKDAAAASLDSLGVSNNTSDILQTISAINANKNASKRSLAGDEASIKRQNMQALYDANNTMIDEQDKKWNYNENMPYQMRVAALRDKVKTNQELTMKGIEAQASFDAANVQAIGSMAGGAMGMMCDERVKENIIDSKYGLAEVLNIRTIDFKYINGSENYVGFIAQNIQKVVPEAVGTTIVKNGGIEAEVLVVDVRQLVPVLVKSIQELSEKVNELQIKLASQNK
jgi:hypothetical protein